VLCMKSGNGAQARSDGTATGIAQR
jgi:hypothetical protein